MRSIGKRSLFLACVGAVSVPLAAAALAYGCTAVATLAVSQGAATPGTTVAVTGKFFGTHDPSVDNTNGLAEIRLGSLTGPVLTTAAPAGVDRSFTVQVKVPAGTPTGDTFLAATQERADGTVVYGTPARQAFKVLATSTAAGGGSTSAPANNVTTTDTPADVAEGLTLAEARRLAKMRIERADGAAKRIRTNCARRSATSARCNVKWTSKGKKRAKKLVVKSQVQSSAW